MSRPKKPTLSHWLENFAYRALEQSLRFLSLETTFRLGEFVGTLIHLLLPGQRKGVVRNLRFAFGNEKSRAEIDDLTARIFARTGANLFCSIRVPFSSDTKIEELVEFEELKTIIEITGDQGIVAVTPHMGNWELLAQAAQMASGTCEAGTHYRPLNNPLLNRLVERRRKKRGLKLFAKRSSGHSMAAFVKNGGFLGVLADQRVGGRGAPGVFFGRPTTCSPLPEVMARRGKGRLFSLVCETIGIARWKVTLSPIPEISTQACTTSLEIAWRHSPEDVFWFEDRWRLRGRNALAFLEKYPADHQATRPLRLVNLAPDEIEPPAFSPTLVSCEEEAVLFEQTDSQLGYELQRISESGETPVDIFVAPPGKVGKVSQLAGKTLVISGSER